MKLALLHFRYPYQTDATKPERIEIGEAKYALPKSMESEASIQNLEVLLRSVRATCEGVVYLVLELDEGRP